MKYLKAFIAGMAFPATLLPFVYWCLYTGNYGAIRDFPLQFFPMFLPIAWGMWNVFDVFIGDKCPVKNINLRMWTMGIILGLMVAYFGLFIVELPLKLFGMSGASAYSLLIFVPIFYGLLWRYIVKHLNALLNIVH